jgi:hypothetical protein
VLGKTYKPLTKYFKPAGYYNAEGYLSPFYDKLYYDGYGYNFYYGAYCYYEYSVNDYRKTKVWVIILMFIGIIFAVIGAAFCNVLCKAVDKKLYEVFCIGDGCKYCWMCILGLILSPLILVAGLFYGLYLGLKKCLPAFMECCEKMTEVLAPPETQKT